jgi:thiol-disulfide isomerase/thioredoxin
MSILTLIVALALALALAAAPQAPTAPPRPVTLVSQVRDALNAHDLAAAEAIVTKARAGNGETSEVIEAMSWLARGSLAERQFEKADRYVDQVQRLAKAALGTRPIDADAKLVSAVGAAIEVRGQTLAQQGARTDAIVYLQRELDAYRKTTLVKRIQKNINLLTLEGHPAPRLDLSESIGPKPPSFDQLKGKVVVLFFWAHWCPDCKIEGPILAKLYAKYQAQGLAIVAPTQRFGYVARGAEAPPDEELRYIVQVRDQYYPFMAPVAVPLPAANHQRYGVSSTPTVVIVDRKGTIRRYHPGQMTEEELEQQVRALLDERS